MDILVEAVGPALMAAFAFLAGYHWHKAPGSVEVVERVRVERVDVPKIIVKEILKIERVEVPVLVDRPMIQIERVEVPKIIDREVVKIVEKPVLHMERVPMSPLAEARLLNPRPAPSPSMVEVVFMDANEAKVKGTSTMDARLRRPTLMRDGAKFMCVKQDATGRWVYRQVAS